MKATDLRVGAAYAVPGTPIRGMVMCLDAKPRWGNRPLARRVNGLIGRIPDEWDDDLTASLLRIEPFDVSVHSHKRGWPLFIVSYEREGRPPLLVPRAICIQAVRPWEVHLAACEATKAAHIAAEARYNSPAEQARQKRLRDEHEKSVRQRAVVQRQRERKALTAIEVLSRLGVNATTDWSALNVLIPVDDLRRLLADIAPEEMALAVLGGA